MVKCVKLVKFLLFSTLLFSTMLSATDYTSKVEDISNRFDNAYKLYENSDINKAANIIRSGYFEVFEDLEGPIRINVSSKKSSNMESQFTEIRAMIKANKPKEEIKEAMSSLVKELHDVLPEINGGHVLVGEASDHESSSKAEGSFKVDYTSKVEDISNRFDNAYKLYENSDINKAANIIRSGYFEVFEDLEGPIRINVSSKKSSNMESQFTEIRAMIKANKPKEEIKEAMSSLVKELHDVLPEINGGHVLVGEASDTEESHQIKESTKKSAKSANILPTWQVAIDGIEKDLDSAVNSYKSDNSKKSRALVKDAQFNYYRNTGFERSIRINVSAKIEQNTQSMFINLVKFMHTKPSKSELKEHVDVIMHKMRELATNLPLVDAAKKVDSDKEKKSGKIDFEKISDSIFSNFDKAISLYKNNKKAEAIALVQDTYFDIFEASGMENAIGAKNVGLKTKLESYFSKAQSLMNADKPVEDLQEMIVEMKVSFEKAGEILSKGSGGFIGLFLSAFLLIVREGFEALLIVTAVVVYLVKSGNKDKLPLVYSSMSVAIILSFITAFAMHVIFGETAGVNREILEGITMLVASVLLFYVSYWLLSNATAQKWTKYIKSQVQNSIDSNSTKALWFTVFLAVYREGAEVVLFYQALAANVSTKMDYIAISGGFVSGVIVLIIIYAIMKLTAIKIPIKPFFLFSGILIYVMAFVFVGQGVMELVEGKVFIPTPIDGLPTFTSIGFYPYVQTFIPQLIVLLVGIYGAYLLLNKQNNKEKN